MLVDIEKLSYKYYQPDLRKFRVGASIGVTDKISYFPIDSPQTAKYELEELAKTVSCTEPEHIHLLKTKGMNSIAYIVIYENRSNPHPLSWRDRFLRMKLASYTLTLEKI